MSAMEKVFLVFMAAAIIGTAGLCGYMGGKEELRSYQVIKLTDRR